MKKIFAIALALIMALGIASSAMAISWGVPTVSASASAPFSAEVIKLGANAGVTGYEYYSVINDAAAYNYSNIFYAIKLSLPSASQANSAYSGAKYNVGDQIKVTINYTNVSGKTAEVKYVTIGSSAKTLWYNGKLGQFEESWVPSVTNSCGCGDQHVMRAMATGTGEVKIKVCFSAKGELKDMKLAGCYEVAKKEFCGVKPCANCKPQDIKGFLFSGECARFPVFFATNAANRVIGAYAIDSYANAYANYDVYGSMKQVETTKLYGWRVKGPYCGDCYNPGVTNGTEFTLEESIIPAGKLITVPTAGANPANASWVNSNKIGSLTKEATCDLFTGSSGMVASTCKIVDANGNDLPVVRNADTFNTVYIKNKDDSFTPYSVANLGKLLDDLATGSNLYRNKKASEDTANTTAITKAPAADGVEYLNVITLNGTQKAGQALPSAMDDNRYFGKDWSKYGSATPVVGAPLKFYTNETYYFCYAASYEHLFQQLTADRVDCDTNDAAYLNSLNHLYSVLGFTFADVMAGNVYMTEDILLANFGFAIAPCSEAVWGAYTASITVAPVAEVPATGSVGFLGFLFIGLSAVATVANRKRYNTK